VDKKVTKIVLGNSAVSKQIDSSKETFFQLPLEYVSFYISDEPGVTGWPLNGTLFEDSEFSGTGSVSFFDPVLNRSAFGLLAVQKSEKASWRFIRKDDTLTLILSAGAWELRSYKGNEPDWSFHDFPFRNLPEESAEVHHTRIRALLDFCAGTRTADAGFHYQSPNSVIGKGYPGDGIPDTFFHFISVYDHLSEKRQAWFRKQFEWLGEQIRFDGCIPWGGCIHGQPYYNVWKRQDCGLFFDGNGLWLEVMNRIEKRGIEVDLSTVVRAADFYLHYLSPDGLLVAAESRMRGCEWADFIQSGWKGSLINIIACRGLLAAANILNSRGEKEIASRYEAAVSRLKTAINLSVEEGGLWMGNGFADWVKPDGSVVRTWRIDANMLAIVWDVATPEHAQILYEHFKKEIKGAACPVPFPYLLNSRWDEPEDLMLEKCREFGCGTDAMPGRMGSSTIAAARKVGDRVFADSVLKQLVDLIDSSEFLWEKYNTQGIGYGSRSYIEHAVSVMLADALEEGISREG